MKKRITFLFLLNIIVSYSQKDAAKISSKYLEDQLYMTISYNALNQQPNGINSSDFSYGLSGGFIKDLPLNKDRDFGLAIGLGYAYDSYNHHLKVSNTNNEFIYENGNNLSNNKLTTHAIEIPFEIRWRNSTLKKYAFWRVYTGIKMTYNFSNNFSYTENNTNFNFSNITEFNKWQAGLTLSAGYDAFNIYLYYGLSPILKNTTIASTTINTKVLKFGLVFYIL